MSAFWTRRIDLNYGVSRCSSAHSVGEMINSIFVWICIFGSVCVWGGGVLVRAYMCVRAYERACVRACMRPRSRVCVCVCSGYSSVLFFCFLAHLILLFRHCEHVLWRLLLALQLRTTFHYSSTVLYQFPSLPASVAFSADPLAALP